MNRKTVWAAAAVLASVLPAFAQVKDWKDIRYPALPEFKIPKPETFTLKNGLRVYLLPDHELPLVTVAARIRAGASLVQLYSAMVYEGPGIARRIVRGLEALMRRDGFTSLAEAVGSE